jgi:hypothetical protein
LIQRFDKAIDMRNMTTNNPIRNRTPLHKKAKIPTNTVVKIQIKNSRILPNNPKKINAPTSNTNKAAISIFSC